MARKFVLLLALVAAMGMGCGWLAEDMCSIGGANADDPSTPVATAEFALPSHTQTAPKALIPFLASTLPFATAVRAGNASPVPQARSSVAPSLQNPRRC